MNARGLFPASRQAGVVLFVAMIILLVLSLLGAMAAHSAITEYKMAVGARDSELARIATDSALAEARSKVAQAAVAFGASQVCAHLSCTSRDAAAPVDALGFMQGAAGTTANPFHVDLAKLSDADASARLATNARYAIEDLGPGPVADGATIEASAAEPVSTKSRYFHLTAIAAGGTGQYVETGELVFGVKQ